MSKDSPIQWCDSSLNLQMGCDGCELWNGKKRVCYAGIQIDGDGTKRGLAGVKGWPTSFGAPALFPHRLEPALKWKDLTGTERPDKPWMNGLPRIIFLNDMGDTFSKKLPLEWMADHLDAMSKSPHQFLVLTKRPSRAVEFSRKHPFPDNFWIGTSVTSRDTEGRVAQLLQVEGGRLKFVSFEPLWSEISAKAFEGVQWSIFGGESGANPTRTCMDHIAQGMHNAVVAGSKVFVKQLGARPYFWGSLTDPADDLTPTAIDFTVKDSHGGDWNEWPEALRVREMPSPKEDK